jgi:hypothetical protein
VPKEEVVAKTMVDFWLIVITQKKVTAKAARLIIRGLKNSLYYYEFYQISPAYRGVSPVPCQHNNALHISSQVLVQKYKVLSYNGPSTLVEK